MRVAFVNNQIDNRGTGNALFDYAHYNETLLGNESIIVSLGGGSDEKMRARLIRRFGHIYSGWDLATRNLGIDVVYHIKSGENDGSLILPDSRYVVHAVFNASQPHGDAYATISRWMGERFGVPYVPHIVELGPHSEFRYKYKIPTEAKVFGRHGGPDTFDIPWVWDAINTVLKRDPLTYFIFLGTDIPDVVFYDTRRVKFIAPSADSHFKSSFIHACDAMLHARARGETFGIAVGEFALAGKLVYTFGDSGERAHIQQLGPLAYLYYNEKQLVDGLLNFSPNNSFRSYYDDFTPENVMKRFKEVFLDGGNREAITP